MYKVTVSHGQQRYLVSFENCPSPTSEELAEKIQALTAVPISQQKLIHKGKQVPIGPTELRDLNVKPGSKLMLLGRQYNPEHEEIDKFIRKIKADAEKISQRLEELNSQLLGIRNGHLPDDLHPEALAKIHKQCVGSVEESMKLLEKLDSLQIPDEHLRKQKKNVIIQIQKLLDDCDKLMEKL